MVEHISRRQFVVTSIITGGAAVNLLSTPAQAVPTAKFRLSERTELRLKVNSKKTHPNGKLMVGLYGTVDGDDHFKDDFITWGPFGDQEGVTKSIYLSAGNFEIRIDGGFINYSVAIQGRSVREKNKQRTPFRTLASRSGTIRKKG